MIGNIPTNKEIAEKISSEHWVRTGNYLDSMDVLALVLDHLNSKINEIIDYINKQPTDSKQSGQD